MRTTLTLIATAIACYCSSQNYSVSPTFGEFGPSLANGWAGSEAAQEHELLNDGTFLLAGTGYWNSPNAYSATVAKFDTACGQLDPSFGTNGIRHFIFEQRSSVYGMDVQADGKIVLAGNNSTSNGLSSHKPSVYRLNSDGSNDTTFNISGFLKTPFDGVSTGTFYDVFVLPDGRISAVGISLSNINGGTNAFGAQRFLPDGTLDTSFAGSGISRILPPSGYFFSWRSGTGAIQADGKLLVAAIMADGANVGHVAMARFNTNGSADTTFGANGVTVTTVNMSSNSGDGGLGMDVQPDGKILVSGTAASDDFIMARFLSDGSVDVGYGVNGVSTFALTNGRAHEFELQGDGSTLQFGEQHWNNGPGAVVKRLSDGSIDTGFGLNGMQAIDFDPTATNYEKYWGGFSLPSGRIIAYGMLPDGNQGDFLVVRLTTDPSAERFADLGVDIAVCEFDSVMLDAGNGTSWLWQDSSMAQTLWATDPGDYSVVVTNALGCKDRDSLTISQLPAPAVPVVSLTGIDMTTNAQGTLQWYLNGAPIAGAVNAMHTATLNGDYTVSVTDANGCTSFSAITNVATVGIETLGQSAISIFPNPASDLILVTGLSSVDLADVKVFDVKGSVTRLVQVQAGNFDVSQLSSGLYTLVIRSRTGRMNSTRLLID